MQPTEYEGDGLMLRVATHGHEVKMLCTSVAERDAWTAWQLGNWTAPGGAADGFAWDRWSRALDQHVGLWYGGDEEGCDARANATRVLLQVADLPVAERQEPDAHLFYAGYGGEMIWEYQFGRCDAGRPDWPRECACDPDNCWWEGESCSKQDDSWCL